MDKVCLDSGKSVLLSEPYDPHTSMLSRFQPQGRENELRAILAAWIGSSRHLPLCPLMIGEPGVGKNRIVYELAAMTGLRLYILQGHEDITAEDLACSVRFADDAERGMEYVLSPLVTAMHRGGIFFFDEIGKVRPRALSLLVSVLDERRYIDSTLLGERIAARPAFRFVAATNTNEEHELPEFVRSRMRPVVRVGFPDRQHIIDIVSNQAGVETHRAALLEEFWNLWDGRSVPPTPRDAIQLFALASSMGAYRQAGGKNLHARRPGQQFSCEALVGHPAVPDIEVQDLKAAFEDLFPQGS